MAASLFFCVYLCECVRIYACKREKRNSGCGYKRKKDLLACENVDCEYLKLSVRVSYAAVVGQTV